jgi:DNA-binding NarL/FixJ family response regulator
MAQQRHGRILIVDDLPQWREELTEILQAENYLVDSAATIDAAFQKLQNTFFHLLILDLRMNSSDISNFEGVAMLKILSQYSLNDALQIVILSAHGTFDHVHEAFHDHKVADFLPKDRFSPDKLLTCVREALKKINLELEIHWEPLEAEEQVLSHIDIQRERIRPGTQRYQQVREELADLLCRLFGTANSVLVRPLAPGFSGTGVMLVQPFNPYGGARVVVTKFGATQKIEKENTNFNTYVLPFIGGGRNTMVQSVRYTPLLGGIIYSLLGTANERLEDFGTFYQKADSEAIQQVLDNLFFDTCKSWYANLGRQQLCDLTENYNQTFGEASRPLEETLDGLIVPHPKQRFSLRALDDERTFTDPLPAATRPFRRSTYISTTHGDLNQHNILIDDEHRAWLIDFCSTGQGHYLRDLAMLDSVVRFQLLTSRAASLEERLHMEEALCRITRFTQLAQAEATFQTANAALRKAYLTIIHIRRMVRHLDRLSNDDMSEYFIALLHNALRTLTFSTLSPQQRQHALLCASLLLDNIDGHK